MTGYTVVECTSNLRDDAPSKKLYSVEPSQGGGIEFTGHSLEEAEQYIESVGGVLEYLS